MKKITSRVAMFLVFCCMLLIPLAVSADDGGELNVDSEGVCTFEKIYPDYPGGLEYLIVKSGYYKFTAPVDGILSIPEPIANHYLLNDQPKSCRFNTFKDSSKYGTDTNVKAYPIKKGNTYTFSFYSTSVGEKIYLAYHVHSTVSYQGKKTYTTNNESTCKLVVSCQCKGGSYVSDEWCDSYPDVITYPAHEWGPEQTVAGTCTSQGYTYKECKNCHYVSKYNYTKASGHIYTGAITQCSGWSHYVQCKNCSDKTTKNHTWVMSANLATKTCSGCKRTEKTGIVVKAANIAVTKLAKNQVSITVYNQNGASAIEVYEGSKMIKRLSGYGTFTYKKSGADKKAYRTRCIFKANGKTVYSGFSKYAKAQKNVWTDSTAGKLNPRNMRGYGYSTHRTSKLYFAGNKLKCTAYIYNVRVFKLKKIKISYTLRVGNKTYRKNITKTVNVAPFGKKKITYTLGSGISNIRTGITLKSVSTKGNWAYVSGWQ